MNKVVEHRKHHSAGEDGRPEEDLLDTRVTRCRCQWTDRVWAVRVTEELCIAVYMLFC